MKPNPIITSEKESGIVFTTVTVNINPEEPYGPKDFLLPGICKVVLITNRIKKVFYFRNFVEMSKEKIIQDERIKELNR
jgi:hypothetical protein